MKQSLYLSGNSLSGHRFRFISQVVLLSSLLIIPTTSFAQQEPELREADRLHLEFLSKYEASKAAELRPIIERVLFLREKHFGTDHPVVADTLLNVAILQRDLGDFARAEGLLNRALAIQEKAFGAERHELVGSLYNLAILQRISGNFAAAESLYRRGLTILEKSFGADSLEITGILNELAVLYNDNGDYVAAEPLYNRVVFIREKRLGKEHPDLAETLFNLAILQRNRGDLEKAEPLFVRTLAMQEKSLGIEHPQVADTLFNLAVILRIRNEYAKAETHLQRALTIQEKTFGVAHSEITGSLHELGMLYRDTGAYDKAVSAFSRVLNIREALLGNGHHSLAAPLSGLASVYQARKDYARAEPVLQRALSIQENVLISNHPDIAETITQLARLYEATDRYTQAIDCQTRANQITESNLVYNLSIGSERQKLAYLKMLALGLDLTISLQMNAAPQTPELRELALMTLLQRKGRGLDAMADIIGTLRRLATAEEQKLFDELAAARSRLAQLLLDGSRADNPQQLRELSQSLEEQIEMLEAEISRRNAAFRVQTFQFTLESVRDALSPTAALIEFAEYDPFDAKTGKFSPARYAVWVLERGAEVKSVDLGSAAEINAIVSAFRKALRDPLRRDVKRVARALDEKILRPVRQLLGPSQHLLIAPDSQLNLIPFAALMDEDSKYLIERFDVSYLTSGRDLLRRQFPRSHNNPPVIIADPEFGDPPVVKTGQSGRLQIDESKMIFPPLRGTREELRLIKSSLPEALVLTKEQATETTLKRLTSPSILHIATHGFFLSEDSTAPTAGTRNRKLSGRNSQTRMSRGVAQVAHPLLRSGLALAGANQGKSGDDDGVLTAFEAAGLNLWGTRLVVLSACDTGVGDIRNGEGVYGLRRALVLAGAESQMISLWPVSDLGTRDLMAGFYLRLQQGSGRSVSLREAQLQMLRNDKHKHPFYWASFILSGDWSATSLTK